MGGKLSDLVYLGTDCSQIMSFLYKDFAKLFASNEVSWNYLALSELASCSALGSFYEVLGSPEIEVENYDSCYVGLKELYETIANERENMHLYLSNESRAIDHALLLEQFAAQHTKWDMDGSNFVNKDYFFSLSNFSTGHKNHIAFIENELSAYDHYVSLPKEKFSLQSLLI